MGRRGKSQYRWETNGRERGLHKEQENKPDIPLPFSPGVLCGRTRPQSVWLWKSEPTYSGEIQTLWKRKTPLLKEKVPANFTCSESHRRSSNLKGAWSELLSILTNLPVRQRSPWGSRHWWRPLWGVGSTISELVLWSTVLESSQQLIALWPGSRPTLLTSLKAPIQIPRTAKPGRNKSQPQADIHKPLVSYARTQPSPQQWEQS